MWLRPGLSGNFDLGTGQISAVSRKLPLHVNALLCVLMRRQSKCEPFRDESFGALLPCGCCCSGFLSGLSSRGGDACFDLSLKKHSLQVEKLDSEQEALVDWAVLQLQGSEGKCQRTRLGVKDFSTQVKTGNFGVQRFY